MVCVCVRERERKRERERETEIGEGNIVIRTNENVVNVNLKNPPVTIVGSSCMLCSPMSDFCCCVFLEDRVSDLVVFTLSFTEMPGLLTTGVNLGEKMDNKSCESTGH